MTTNNTACNMTLHCGTHSLDVYMMVAIKFFFSETGKFADNLEDNKNIVTIQTILVIFVYESMCFFYCFCY